MKEALDAIKRQGATNIIARSQKPPDDSSTASRSFVANYGLTYRDYEKFQTLTAISRHVPMRDLPPRDPPARADAQRPRRRHHARSTRTSTSWSWRAAGSWSRRTAGCSATSSSSGPATADRLFPFDDPIGQTIVLSEPRLPGRRRHQGADADRRDRRQPGGRGLQQRRLHAPRPRRAAGSGDVIMFRSSGLAGGGEGRAQPGHDDGGRQRGQPGRAARR